jgi:hypothetical protein
MVRLLFLVLLCSLVMPRAAWGAHLTGHQELSVAGAVHTHHGNHAHEHDVPDSVEHNGALDGEGGEDGLTHDHSTAFAVGSAVVLPDPVTLSSWQLPVEAKVARERNGKHLRHPESLLRPPRTA